ncbi:MAG: hypothetical protein GXP45_00035 [bacterium]|nr:hypothetical protein [bacterium]
MINKIFQDPLFKKYNIIFMGNFHQELGNTICMQKDKELIQQLFSQKSLQNYKRKFPHIYHFQQLNKKQLKHMEIMAYLNSAQLGSEEKNCTGYSCIIA